MSLGMKEKLNMVLRTVRGWFVGSKTDNHDEYREFIAHADERYAEQLARVRRVQARSNRIQAAAERESKQGGRD